MARAPSFSFRDSSSDSLLPSVAMYGPLDRIAVHVSLSAGGVIHREARHRKGTAAMRPADSRPEFPSPINDARLSLAIK